MYLSCLRAFSPAALINVSLCNSSEHIRGPVVEGVLTPGWPKSFLNLHCLHQHMPNLKSGNQSKAVCDDVAALQRFISLTLELWCQTLQLLLSLCSYFFNPSSLLCPLSPVRWEMCHSEVTVRGGLGQERSGLNYSDTLIRALGKVVCCMCGCVKCLWICTATMHHRGRSQGLCVCRCACAASFRHESQRDRGIGG